MQRWLGRVAVVTGGGYGIGKCIVEDLVTNGMKVAAVDIQEDKLKVLKDGLQGKKGSIHTYKTDISKEDEIIALFKKLKDDLGGVDVMINNAGIFIPLLTIDGDIKEWRKIYDVNVFGMGACAREALKSMKERNVDDGHIININSIVAHHIIQYPKIAPYSSSKHASRCVTEGLRRELAEKKSRIKVTSISPGVVDTALWTANKGGGLDKKAFVHLQPEDIAEAVHYALATGPNCQVNELIVRPVGDGY